MICTCRDFEDVLKDLDMSSGSDTFDCNICGRFFFVEKLSELPVTSNGGVEEFSIREVTINFKI